MPAITVQTQTHPRGWILVLVSVCGIWHGHFMINTFTPVSSVSASTGTMLEACGCLVARGDSGQVLQGLTLGGRTLPDLRVRVSRAASMLEIEGMLGLDFLNQFTAVRFDVAERTLTLWLP